MARVKIGVAFAGGGVRGASHLGIMQALYENSIYPEIFTGASAGSIVATMLPSGYRPLECLDKFKAFNENLIDIAYGHIAKGALTTSKIEGFVKGDKLEELLTYSFDRNVGMLSPLAIATTDIDGGKQIIFTTEYDINDHFLDESRINDDNYEVLGITRENISKVVRASCSMPTIFIPQKISGYKLIDGGITNNLPSDLAWALGADKVISLDLGYSGEVKTDGFIDIGHMAVNLLMERVTDGNSNDYGLYLNPRIYDITALDTDRIVECYDRGYTYGLSQIDNVVKMLEED